MEATTVELAAPRTPPTNDEVERTSILLVDADVDRYLPSLRRRFEVTTASTADQAIRALRSFHPTLVITELALPEGDGAAVCRESKAGFAARRLVLATTAVPERVPDALIAGCDAVLLKPFPPVLLFTRIGRLLRWQAKEMRDRAMWQRAKAELLIDRSDRVLSGTNIVWPEAQCPTCGRGDAISFDAASHRRMWYACLACRKVWLAARREGSGR